MNGLILGISRFRHFDGNAGVLGGISRKAIVANLHLLVEISNCLGRLKHSIDGERNLDRKTVGIPQIALGIKKLKVNRKVVGAFLVTWAGGSIRNNKSQITAWDDFDAKRFQVAATVRIAFMDH